MWNYERKLLYPVKIKNKNPRLAQIVISQYGGPDGELSASLRYLSQRFSMPTPEIQGILNDIGNEELSHLEMVGTIVYQLTRDLDSELVKDSGFYNYFINHSTGVYPANTNGMPFNALTLAVTGDPLAHLSADSAAEQKARATYDNILRLSDDPDVNDVIKFLREREIVHYQRFGEALRMLEEKTQFKKQILYGFRTLFAKIRLAPNPAGRIFVCTFYAAHAPRHTIPYFSEKFAK